MKTNNAKKLLCSKGSISFGHRHHRSVLASSKKSKRRVSELEAGRDLSRVWMHVDMDAFYAAVETLDDPSLSSKPMAVGGMSMISTANYEARKFGVRAAMPGFIGCKLCPDLIFVKPNFEKYSHYSELTRQVFRLYDKHFIARSLDEAYLDITELCKQENATAAEVAERLRKDVFENTKLTCSAGVAPNRLLAKVCSDINKPNGQYVLGSDCDEVMTFISALPIRKVSGIGKVTERLLKDVLGIKLCFDFIEQRYIISALFSPTSRDFFLSVGLGVGGSETPQEESRKSISNERTFSPTNDEESLVKIIGELAEGLAEDMVKEGLQGRTLTLKLKSSTFEVRNRAVSMQHYISSKEDIETSAIKLLRAELPLSLRLIGVRISHFKEHDPGQKTLEGFVKLVSDTQNKSEVADDQRNYRELDSTFLSGNQDPSKNICDDFLETDSSDSEVALNEARVQGETHWTEDNRCLSCGEKISSDFPWLRQEHEDFHLALKLQQQDAPAEISKTTANKRVKPQDSNARSSKKLAGATKNSIQSYFSKA